MLFNCIFCLVDINQLDACLVRLFNCTFYLVDITIGVVLNLGAVLAVFHILCGYTNWMLLLFNGCMSIG